MPITNIATSRHYGIPVLSERARCYDWDGRRDAGRRASLQRNALEHVHVCTRMNVHAG